MHKLTNLPRSRLSARIMIFGSYAVLCCSALLILYSSLFSYVPTHELSLLIEHILMSLTLVFIGGFLADVAKGQQKK